MKNRLGNPARGDVEPSLSIYSSSTSEEEGLGNVMFN